MLPTLPNRLAFDKLRRLDAIELDGEVEADCLTLVNVSGAVIL